MQIIHRRAADAATSRRPRNEPASALWGRGGRRIVRVLLATLVFGCGLAASAAVLAPQARSSAFDTCILPAGCLTLPAVTVPTVPVVTTVPIVVTTPPVVTAPTSTTTAPPGSTDSVETIAAADGSPAAQQPGAAIAPLKVGLRISVLRRGGVRWVQIALSLSRPATVHAQLLRGRALMASRRLSERAGQNRIALAVPRRARAGRYVLSLSLQSGSAAPRIITRRVLIGR